MSELLIPQNHRILVIDDNPAIHEDYCKVFRPADATASALDAAENAMFGDIPVALEGPAYEIDSAYQGESGLSMARHALASGRPYAMAFVDMRMPPGWDGVETTLRLWEACPDLQVVICTAYSDYAWNDMLDRLGRTDRLLVLKKPFDQIEVLQLGHAMTEKWRLLQQDRAHLTKLEDRVADRTQELEAANARLHAEIAERERTAAALRQAQKMEAVGHLAGGIAHDFNNLLSVIRGYTGLISLNNGIDDQVKTAVREVDSAAERAAGLARQLLTFSRKQVMTLENLRVNEVLEQMGKLIQRVLREDIALNFELADDVPPVRADRAMIEQVILNLAVNSRDAMNSGGSLTVRSAMNEFTEEEAQRHPGSRAGRFASFSVTDTGRGIAPEVLPRIFEPFFTTKEVGQGTGLGLATAYGIVQQHEGWIEVESTVDQGTTIRIYLPGLAIDVEDSPRHTLVSRIAGGTETILVVEDEAALRNAARLALEHFGYHVITACSGMDALKVWEGRGDQIDLLLTDMVMPDGLSGRELAARLQGEKPGLKVLFSSGYTREFSDSDFSSNPGLHFLPKPYTPQKLAAAVRACLESEPVIIAAAA
jgi:two-component system NtrC family sensor kinase